MRRMRALILSVVALLVFAGLVHLVLVAANASEYAATTVQGPTVRRIWATAALALALGAVVTGALALARPGSRFGTSRRRFGALTGTAGLVAVVNGALVLATATGGPGSGNGVVGGAAALVLGLIALALGVLGLAVWPAFAVRAQARAPNLHERSNSAS